MIFHLPDNAARRREALVVRTDVDVEEASTGVLERVSSVVDRGRVRKRFVVDGWLIFNLMGGCSLRRSSLSLITRSEERAPSDPPPAVPWELHGQPPFKGRRSLKTNKMHI